MITQRNLLDNPNVKVVDQMGGVKVLEHVKDKSTHVTDAFTEYYSSKMNIHKRQVLIELNGDAYTVQAGAMQWTSGDVNADSGVSGVGNFLGKMVASKVTGESAVKPVYRGKGSLMLEPTYNHILLIDVSKWGTIVLEDGMFLACDNSLQQKVVARSNLTSAIAGGEGLFNLTVSGNGVLVCESSVPMNELIEVTLENDVMKIDGNMAVAWSGSLNFTVEKSSRSLVGSAMSGEGLVNVFRGTGKILMAPTARTVYAVPVAATTEGSATPGNQTGADTAANVMDAIGGVLDLFN